jgi:phosphomannomutase
MQLAPEPTMTTSAFPSHSFHPTLLRQYDIRGIVGKTLFLADAEAIGAAFATLLQQRGGRTVAVGYDGRLHSPDFADALVRGLTNAGADVVNIGLCPTPQLYYATHALGTDGGIMITGSHNPPDYNGFKMVMLGKPFFGADIQEIGRIAAAGACVAGCGSASARDLTDAFVARLVEGMNFGPRVLKVAWDAGNGAAGEAMRRLVQRLPGQHILLNEVIDGTFPAHHPDPTIPEYLEQLIAAVRDNGCDLGIAFDGDGDRIGVVDDQGVILWGDQMLVFLAEPVLAAQPGATIIADVKASQTLFDAIAERGGVPLMWKTGHSLIKAKMAETGAPLAGEMSGHVFFADRYYGFDDALYAAVRLLEVLSHRNQPLSVLRRVLPDVINTPELRLDCDETRKFRVIDDLKAVLAADGADVHLVDGVRVRTADGWWLLRASNTQAVLVARCEAASEAGLARLKDQLLAYLARVGMTDIDLAASVGH